MQIKCEGALIIDPAGTLMLDYQMQEMKEEVRRLEVVKRELIQENKKTKPERYAR